jgi:Putative Flp pilus-assembly TadE/G-like
VLRGRRGSERGSVAITVTLAMTVLLGFAALVVDVGLNWATRTAAQTAADSAALGGASQLLVGGGAAAIDTVEDLLDKNVSGLVGSVGASWAVDGDEANGEVVCWTLPNPAPGPGAACPDGSNALQVITPPIEVRHAFAGLLGQSTNDIKARAAAAAGPAAPNNCVLCVLEPSGANALNVLGSGGIEVSGGGIVVNSDNRVAVLVDPLSGTVSADQIRVVGGVDDTAGLLLPLAELNGPPVPDPLADLPAPVLPPLPNPAQDITANTTLTQGVYAGINVDNGATLTLEEGVYVITDSPGFAGFTVQEGGEVRVGDGVTLYLTCDSYPTPCDDEDGAGFQLDEGGRFRASPPATGPPAPDPYAGLSIFADRGNTRPMLLDGGLNLPGAIYAASAQLQVGPRSRVQVGSLVIVDRLLAASAAQLQISYDPGLPLIAIEPPVLIS